MDSDDFGDFKRLQSRPFYMHKIEPVKKSWLRASFPSTWSSWSSMWNMDTFNVSDPPIQEKCIRKKSAVATGKKMSHRPSWKKNTPTGSQGDQSFAPQLDLPWPGTRITCFTEWRKQVQSPLPVAGYWIWTPAESMAHGWHIRISTHKKHSNSFPLTSHRLHPRWLYGFKIVDQGIWSEHDQRAGWTIPGNMCGFIIMLMLSSAGSNIWL